MIPASDMCHITSYQRYLRWMLSAPGRPGCCVVRATPPCRVRVLCAIVWAVAAVLSAGSVSGSSVLSPGESAAGSALSAGESARLERFVEDLMRCRRVPGLSLAVVREGSVAYAQGFGYTDVRTGGRPVTNRTMFCVGSLTKGFTATVLAALISQNRSLSWDTPVQSILGQHFRLSDEHRTKYANIRDLLAHKTGVPGYFGAIITGFNLTGEELAKRIEHMPATRRFHSKYMYNNYMYMLAGVIAERISGLSWEQLITTRIFQPLSMTSSSFVRHVRGHVDIALPHESFDGHVQPLDLDVLSMVTPLEAAGSVCSTAEDMARWLSFQLQVSRASTDHHLWQAPGDEHVFSELYTPQFPVPLGGMLRQPEVPFTEGRFAYNLGWGSGTYRGYHNIQHAGELPGLHSLLWFFPDDGVGIFTSMNAPLSSAHNDTLRLLHFHAADTLLGLPHWLNSTAACRYPDGTRRQKSDTVQKQENGEDYLQRFLDPSAEWKLKSEMAYIGVYGHPGFGNMSVSINSTTNHLYMRHGMYGLAALQKSKEDNVFKLQFKGLLRYWSDADTWKNNDITIQFIEYLDGKFQKVQAGFVDTSAPPVFVRDLRMTAREHSEVRHPTMHHCPPSHTSGTQTVTTQQFLPGVIILSIYIHSIIIR